MRTACVVLVLAGCTGEFDPPSLVEDLRVLAIQADPPEVVLEDELPPVALEALVVDPRDAGRTIAYGWSACGLTDDLRCASAPTRLELGEGEAALDGVAATLGITPELRDSATELDTFRGFGGVSFVVELVLSAGGEEETHAIKEIPGPIGLPPGTTPNRNPTAPSVLRDDADWPEDEVPAIAPGAEVSIEPVSPEDDPESYSVFRFDLGTEDLEEHLSYDFFATAGEWTRDTSGGAPDPLSTETTVASRWTAPDEPAGEVTFWIVTRDGRGGTAWTIRTARVEGP